MNDAEGTRQYQINIWNNFAVLENIDGNAAMSKAWEGIQALVREFSVTVSLFDVEGLWEAG